MAWKIVENLPESTDGIHKIRYLIYILSNVGTDG
jgi:hypothetical protein